MQTHAGRPTNPRQPGERTQLSLRVTTEIFAQLDAAAKSKGRPLSSESELRLEQSFRDQDVIEGAFAVAYGPEIAAMMFAIGKTLAAAGPQIYFMSTRKLGDAGDWLSDPYVYDELMKGVARIIEAMRPEGEPIAAFEGAENHGVSVANSALLSLADFPADTILTESMKPIKRILDGSPLVARIKTFLSRTMGGAK